MTFIVKEKLKSLKEVIKVWNKETSGCLESKLGNLVKEIQHLDLLGESSVLDSNQIALKKNLTADWWKTANWRDNLLWQKSRCKWLKEGDANTSYFHACINNRRRRNQIHGRLKGVISSLISPTQSAFIHDRSILDAMVVINEIIHSAKKDKDGCLLFKIDFEKAYDSVDWSFLDYMLSRFDFSYKWRKWIKGCLSSTSMEFFSVSRGIRQGDPMAPFLFLMVAEGFAGLMRNARSAGLFEGYKIGSCGVEVCDLQFADDTILVCKPNVKNLWCIKSILKCFELISGLKVNSHKSSLFGISVSDSFLTGATNFLSCNLGSFPFLYLGIPVGANPRRLFTWQCLIEVVSKRLASWKCKHISFGGRLILINSVLSNIPTYMLSLYKAPKKVLAKIVSLQRNFLWGNKDGNRGIAWVAWDDVCKPKELGGLGVRNLSVFNDSFLGKWKWRRIIDNEAFWVKVINSKYGTDLFCRTPNSASRWWKDLGKVDSLNGVNGG
nr:Line-1 retrotransposon [Lupinus angustifolius]